MNIAAVKARSLVMTFLQTISMWEFDGVILITYAGTAGVVSDLAGISSWSKCVFSSVAILRVAILDGFEVCGILLLFRRFA